MQDDIDDHQEPLSPAFTETTLRDVGQDNFAPPRVRAPEDSSITRNQKPRSHAKRQTEYVMIWVKPDVKRELERIAETEGLSLSRTGAAALEEWLAQRLHIRHAGILEPIIEKAITKQMRAYSSRIAMLLVRSMFTSEQTRALATNILGRQPGVTQPVLEQILDGSSNTAKRNITRMTPQLETLIHEVQKWLEHQA
ncbi:MAG TPA: hypothetical protein VH593_24300 [Ktedonobacteraceae bacterium]|jgi:hypothetical protein